MACALRVQALCVTHLEDPYTILNGMQPEGDLIQINNHGPAGTLTRVDFAVDESPLPEPATWATMLIGLGTIGAIARRRRPAVPQLA